MQYMKKRKYFWFVEHLDFLIICAHRLEEKSRGEQEGSRRQDKVKLQHTIHRLLHNLQELPTEQKRRNGAKQENIIHLKVL